MRNSAKRRHQLSREKPQAAPGQSQGDGRANLQRRLEFGFDTSEWRKAQNIPSASRSRLISVR